MGKKTVIITGSIAAEDAAGRSNEQLERDVHRDLEGWLALPAHPRWKVLKVTILDTPEEAVSSGQG